MYTTWSSSHSYTIQLHAYTNTLIRTDRQTSSYLHTNQIHTTQPPHIHTLLHNYTLAHAYIRGWEHRVQSHEAAKPCWALFALRVSSRWLRQRKSSDSAPHGSEYDQCTEVGKRCGGILRPYPGRVKRFFDTGAHVMVLDEYPIIEQLCWPICVSPFLADQEIIQGNTSSINFPEIILRIYYLYRWVNVSVSVW